MNKINQKTKDWETKKLGEVCNISIGKTPARGNEIFWDKNKKTNNIWLSIRDLKNTKGDEVFDSREYVSDKGAELFKSVEKGTLLVSFKLTLGRLAFAGIDLRTNEAIAALKDLNSELNKNYLYYYLMCFDWDKASEGEEKVKGKTLNKAKLKEIEISFPKSLDEQKRIVGILDEAFENIDKAKTIAKQNLKNIEELFESELQNIFSNNGEGWERNTLGEVCEKTSNIKWSENINKDFKYVDLSAVSRENFKITDFVMVTSENAPSRAKKFIQTGDIIFATTRPTLKRVSMITEDYNNQICSTGFAVLRSNKKMIDKSLIFYFIQSNYFMDFIEKMQRGASYPAVSDSDVKSIQISYPKSLDEQGKIVERLDELKEKVDEGAAILRSKIAALDELKKSLLQKAFNGEL